jgi:hypothetical protein
LNPPAVAELELVRSDVLVRRIAGWGAQFNQHVYAAITNAPLEAFPELEQKVRKLEPQLVRLFYNDRQETAKRDRLASFILAAELAQKVGATINVTWQSGGVLNPGRSMSRFAELLGYLVEERGVTALRWATIQNEPNLTKITPEQNGAMYRALDAQLTRAGLRKRIRFMGGDLVEPNQRRWFQFLATHLAGLLDAYSVHIYWNYWDVARFRRRLLEVQRIVRTLPPSGRKPVFVTEYGIRGRADPDHPKPGVYADGTPIGQTAIAAFQQLWFHLIATRQGYHGTVKWDCYFGRYDRGRQAHYLIGPWQEGWPLYPSYSALRLITETTKPGWQALAVRRRRAARTAYIVAFAGRNDELTIVGLDSRGALLNEPSPMHVSYAIAGLPPRASFTLAVWNGHGDGNTRVVGEVTTDAAGVARVTVPLQAAFALAIVPIAGP